MIELPNKSKCSGCGACSVICPKKAIEMCLDSIGFKYPRIDSTKCIECMKCLSVCKFSDLNYGIKENIVTYAAASLDDEILAVSASGGIFACIARKFIESGGDVYGAAWNEDFSVEHIKISSLEELSRVQGSKYTQSTAYPRFTEIKLGLQAGKKILFSGTPCQVSALYAFLGKSYDGLYTVDLICHGVGSNLMLQDDIRFQEKKYGDKVRSLSFRAKENGWGTSGIISFQKTKRKFNICSSPYYYYFLSNSIFRDSCYNCRYASEGRQGDITLGDYWKIETAHPEIQLNYSKGISCVLVNSEKGRELANNIKNDVLFVNSKLEKVKSRNKQLVSPSEKPDDRDKILSLYNHYGYDALVEYWKKYSTLTRIKEMIKGIFPQKLKIKLKKIGIKS